MSRRTRAAIRAVILDLLSLPPEELRRELSHGGEMADLLIESGLLDRLEYPEIERCSPRRRSWWRRLASIMNWKGRL